MTSLGNVLVVGATAIGGFMLGKAVLDHVLWTGEEKHRIEDEDVSEFEAQHYRAAGFTKKKRHADNVVAAVAGVAGVAYTLYQLPSWIDQIKKL